MHWLLSVKHLPGLAGGIIGLLGTVLLSIDLLRSKKSDEAQIKFQESRTQADLSTQELVTTLTSGFGHIAEFLSGYLSILEIHAQLAEEKALGVKHSIPADLRKLFPCASRTGVVISDPR